MQLVRNGGGIHRPGMLAAAVFLGLWPIALSSHAMEVGKATATVQGNEYTLQDSAIRASWSIEGGHLGALVIEDQLQGRRIRIDHPFGLLLKNGTKYDRRSLHIDGTPEMKKLAPDSQAARYSDRLYGWQFTLPLTDEQGKVHVLWSVILRDGSNYIRQALTISAGQESLPIVQVKMIDVSLSDAQVDGSVKGSPIVAGQFFLGFENPLSTSRVALGRATAVLYRELPLHENQSVTYSSVIGTTHLGQLRRDFLYYLERERAHPYRTFLHYNSWYDLGYFTPYDEAGALDRINTVGTELHDKRGVVLDSFLFDDGWDNHQSLWDFGKGFPDGFTAIAAAAAKYGASPGMWMSPWGGYDGPKKERIEFGRAHGFEIVNEGFALSGPKYYQHFLEVCLQMIHKYGVNQFKFDGTGNADSVFPGSAFDSDFDAAMNLMEKLRQAEPNIYINLTTGTYPSPFWTFYADSIWRGGFDDSETGVGSIREQWITYRDADTYQEVVQAGPLYPLNSLMLHGIIFAQYNRKLNADPGNDFRNEVRSYFGSGTQCQELYITPSLLSSQNWDDLAEAARWSRENADVLRDTHWIGGNPAWLEVYGWASWAPREGILTLRNPSDKPQMIELDIQNAFELPEGASRRYTARSPWQEDAHRPPIELRAGLPHAFHLSPFEVLTLICTPDAASSW
jgi:hypothetical protein